MFHLDRDRSRAQIFRAGGAIMPAIDRKCFDCKQKTSHWCCVCMQVNETGHAQRLNMLKERPRKWFFFAKKLTFFHRWRS